jgi:hypothetical protein
MRYVTKIAKERNRRQDQELAARRHWMTLVEAVKEIKNKESCEDKEALEDLFSAIVDHKVRGLLGDISYEENSLSEYQRLMPHDLQREVKVYLSGPGYIDFADQYPPTTKRQNTDRFDYPKVLLVTGQIGKITFDESDLCKSPVFPDVDELQFGPVLVSRDDMRNWPFALEEMPPSSTQFPETPDVALSQENELLGLKAEPVPVDAAEKRWRHRREATKEAIRAIWGAKGLPPGIMVRQRDDAINKWLVERGRQKVSSETIKRAFAELQHDRT